MTIGNSFIFCCLLAALKIRICPAPEVQIPRKKIALKKAELSPSWSVSDKTATDFIRLAYFRNDFNLRLLDNRICEPRRWTNSRWLCGAVHSFSAWGFGSISWPIPPFYRRYSGNPSTSLTAASNQRMPGTRFIGLMPFGGQTHWSAVLDHFGKTQYFLFHFLFYWQKIPFPI